MLVEARTAWQVAAVFYGLAMVGGAGPGVAAALLVPLPWLLAGALGLLAGVAGTLALAVRLASAAGGSGREVPAVVGAVLVAWAGTAALLFVAA
ncbi:hypothetical protein [Streptomyces sp. NPDC012888]|uniref:hypothetical protein n=1 Tax=Streptomyces sp. NPDC012888 TaxID=3364855 RepID=UPI00367BD33D